MAKVSIILPIYNVQEYLCECLNSVVGQTLTDLEIICVNDGSTDHSLEILREYANQDKRLVVLNGPNGGYGRAMNRGLDCALGEYIGIVEPDDYVPANMFEDLYKIASENRLDFVKADFYRFYRTEQGDEKRIYERLDGTGKYYRRIFNPSQTPEAIRCMLNTWTGIYRRDFINQHHIRHNETPGAAFQDNGFFFQTFVYANRAMLIDKPYYRNRRDNPNSSVKSRQKVYCMNIEYDFIRRRLMADREIWERFQYMYWWKKYHNYMFTFERIDEIYKKEYLQRMRMEFKRAMQRGELSQTVFTPLEWKKIESLIRNAGGYYELLRSAKALRYLLPYIPQPVKRTILKIISWREKDNDNA